MHGKQEKRTPRFFLTRAAAACALILLFCLSSMGTVMANTVSATVLDGEAAYTFSMYSADLEDILAQAQERGLPPLGPLDVAERVDNTTTVNIRRGVAMRVRESGRTSEFVAYLGDTVEQALAENNIWLSPEDQVSPGRDMRIQADLAVEVKRCSQVTVTADGKVQTVTMTGGTVADALKQAKVRLGEEDTCNYGLDEPLFNRMNLRVSRMVQIRITADGQTKEYQVPTERVRAALSRCGIQVAETDRLNVRLSDMVKNGMAITVQRVRVEEEKQVEELDYTTRYEYTDSLYAGETEVSVPGEKGQRETVYSVTYIDGVEESRQKVSEAVTKKPVEEVVRTGTRQQLPSLAASPSLGSPAGTRLPSTGGAGTFVDSMGNTVAYASKMTGECTAYSIPGGTTSVGLEAKRGIIAVNPDVIPYGTRMYVTSPDGSIVYGYGVAGDTGGALLDGTVIADLCYDTVEECSIIGRRDMVLYLLP